MAKVIGIDLGITNSVVAHEDRNGVDVVLNRANERVTRSVVGLHAKSGETIVGTAAADNAARNPQNTIFSIKRLMGRFYDDPNVQEVQRRYQFRVVKPEDGDDVRVMLGDRMLTPTEVSAMILRKMKEDAEARLGDEVTHAVITVPAYFSMSQRLATRMAGEMAGLRVKTIIDEPSAAAIAFGVDLEPGAMKNVLVYDLGGGTFDISVLFIAGQMVTQMTVEGDMWLGGDDFDHAIMDYVLKAVQKEHSTDPSNNGQFMVLLKKAAEKAKIELSEMLSTAIMLAAAVPLPDGSRGDVDVELDRRTFEDLPITSGTIKFGGVEAEELRRWCEELKINGSHTEHGVEFGPDTIRNRVKKSLLLARKAVKEAGVTKEEIDHVLLVGGSTTVPLVQKMLEEEFGPDKIMRNVDPMACVAFGAGIAAERIPGIICQVDQEVNDEQATVCHKCGAQLVAQRMCPECNQANALHAQKCSNCGHGFKRVDLGNVTAKPIGILAAEGTYQVIVAKGTPYPTSEPVVRTLRTTEEDQRAFLVPIYHAEVEEFDPEDVTQWIGAADIDLEGTHLPAGTPVDVSVNIDREGCLDIEAIIQDGSGRRRRVFVDPRLSVGGGRKAEQEGEGGALESERKLEWRHRLEWSIVWAEIALRDYEWVFSDQRTTQTLQRLVTDAREAIKRKDEDKGRELEEKIDRTLEDEFKGLMILLWAEMHCLNIHLEPGKRSQIRSLVKEICDAIPARDDVSKVQAKMEQLADLLKETRDTGPPPEPRERPTFLCPGGGVEPGPEPEAAERRRLSRTPGRFEREAAPPLDRLHFTVTAPHIVQPKDQFVINVWAHLARQRELVMRQAREAAAGEIVAQPKGPFEVARGTLLSVQVRVTGIIVEELEDTVMWSGETGNATFAATVPERARTGRRVGIATVQAGGLRIAQIPFIVTVGRVSDLAAVSHEGEPLRKAFACYANADRDEVLGRIQGMQKVAPQLDVFVDVLSLRSGQYWEQELSRVIPANDIFYLFWSRDASQSEWVEKEWRCALETKGLEFIDPVPLVSPQVVPPPGELASKHFDDWVLAFKRGERQA